MKAVYLAWLVELVCVFSGQGEHNEPMKRDERTPRRAPQKGPGILFLISLNSADRRLSRVSRSSRRMSRRRTDRRKMAMGMKRG